MRICMILGRSGVEAPGQPRYVFEASEDPIPVVLERLGKARHHTQGATDLSQTVPITAVRKGFTA
jgi:hypothetical protein